MRKLEGKVIDMTCGILCKLSDYPLEAGELQIVSFFKAGAIRDKDILNFKRIVCIRKKERAVLDVFKEKIQFLVFDY